MANEHQPEPTIRDATGDDLAAAVALLRRQLDEHDITLDDAALEHAVRVLVEQPEVGRVLIARCGGEIAGVAVLSFLWTLEHGGPAAWLDELYVASAHRGRGIGRQLVEAALQLARGRGCAALDLEVEDGHEDAARLYARMGFARHRRVHLVRKI
jgi:GNAT superfamily N-acetyltransferase